MADYKKMYQVLLRSVTNAISVMQQAQQEAEEICLSAGMPEIRALDIAHMDSHMDNIDDKEPDSK